MKTTRPPTRWDPPGAPKFTPLNPRLYQYILECSRGPAEPVLAALRAETQRRLPEEARMQISPDQGTLLTLLVAAVGAKRVLEVGTFTGYSAICLARGLPPNGLLLCLDVSAEWTGLAQRYWAKAGVAERIELRLGPAAASLRQLPARPTFDFAFIDADKPSYDEYYELVLPRMKRNGLILFDNMLWGGRIAQKRPIKHPNGRAIDALNRKLARDPRVQTVLLPISDGLSLCRVRGA